MPHRKKMTKQLTGKCNDTSLQEVARGGNLPLIMEILTRTTEEEQNRTSREKQPFTLPLNTVMLMGERDDQSTVILCPQASKPGMVCIDEEGKKVSLLVD
ncbi:hypothetical protein NE237_005853 [Protea cynaroides]|uniref:Uncharacterized protein n=1 Tax=Protea cynaroides TaxID=273540 RepID=A0A9Q0KLH7_9MAGN|nr:hypothetical protein NE237_005853 [Protea cynaroides]